MIWGAPENEDRVESEIHSEAVIEGFWRCNCTSRLSELRDEMRGRDQLSLEMHLEAEVEGTQRQSFQPWLCEFGDSIRDWNWVNTEMHWKGVIKWVWSGTWGPKSSELRDTPRGRDRASLEIQFKTVSEWTQRCTWRSWSNEFVVALGGRDQESLEMHLEAMIEWTRSCTPWLWSSKLGDALVAGYDWARLEEYLEVAIWGRSIGSAAGAETLFISSLTLNREIVVMWPYLWMCYGELPGCSRSVSRYAGIWRHIQGSTRNRENEVTIDYLGCMLYTVYAALSVCCTYC